MCDFDESPDVQKYEQRRAAKPHACWACAEEIRRGDRYHHAAVLFDGSWQTFRHCLRCWAICEALWRSGAEAIDFGLDCGEVWEDAPIDVDALAFVTREEMQDRAARQGHARGEERE